MNTVDTIRGLLILGVSQIPEAGAITGGLMNILWPESGEDIWGEIKDQVEKLIDEKISDLVYLQAQEDLDGIINNLRDYQDAIEFSEDGTEIRTLFEISIGSIETAQPHFKSKGNEVLLLPLLTQLANLHLTLMRDCVIHGESWGWNSEYVLQHNQRLDEQIRDYCEWVKTWHDKGYDHVAIPTTGNHQRTTQWAAHNKYVRGMTLQVLDNSFYWPFMSFTGNPSGDIPKLTREIYSDPMGTADDNPINIDENTNPALTGVAIWAGGSIDAMSESHSYYRDEKEYGPRMGAPTGGGDPHFVDTLLVDDGVYEFNPIVEARVTSGDILESVQFNRANGDLSELCGKFYIQRETGKPVKNQTLWRFDGHYMSRVYVTGRSNYYGTIECAIFGFQLNEMAYSGEFCGKDDSFAPVFLKCLSAFT